MHTGNKICALRKMGGLTQEQLSEKLGVSRQTISKWEAGTSTPDWESMMRISSLFSISLDELADKEVDSASEKESSGLSLQDLIKINTHNRKMTMLLMVSMEFITICILAVLVISIINDATSTIQYMLYRYIVVTDYENVLFADYHNAYVIAAIAGAIGVILFAVYFVKERFNRTRK